MEEESCSAANAAESAHVHACCELFSADSAFSDVRADLWSRLCALACIALLLSMTSLRVVSARARNAAMASSIHTRRRSLASDIACSCSACLRSEMFSWMATQPPPAIGWVDTEIMRPSTSLGSRFVRLPSRNDRRRLIRYCSGSSRNVPFLVRYWSSRVREPSGGATTSPGTLYMV